MANFAAALTSTLSNNGQTMALADTSNYTTNTQTGHALADFDEFKIIIADDGNGSLYKYGTSEAQSMFGAMDETILAPSIAFTLGNSYTVPPVTGDSVYTFTLYAVPTFEFADTYTVGCCTWYDHNLYVCIQAGAGHVPDVSPTFWTALSTYENVSDEYVYELKYARVYDLEGDKAAAGLQALNMANLSCSDFEASCVKAKYDKLDICLFVIGNYEAIPDWTKVAWAIGIGKQIANC